MPSVFITAIKLMILRPALEGISSAKLEKERKQNRKPLISETHKFSLILTIKSSSKPHLLASYLILNVGQGQLHHGQDRDQPHHGDQALEGLHVASLGMYLTSLKLVKK